MAGLTMTISHGRYAVAIRGRLTAADLGRLERLCHPALEYRQVPLTIHLTDPVVTDGAALYFLERLAARGAVVTGPTIALVRGDSVGP
jgi:hypothetical protein